MRRGRSPNCSATGSVVGLAIVSVVAAATVLNAFAERFARWTGSGGPRSDDAPAPQPPPTDDPPEPPRVRRETFGGIVAWPSPPALLYVDHAGVDAALAAGAMPVGAGDPPPGALSAPTEVHVALTGRCPVACDGCYLDAGPDRGAEPPVDDLLRDLDALAGMGVFELALGGGEVLLRDDTLDVVAAARARGLVPNLTVAGFGVTPERARRLAGLVGQVNVSLDGLGAAYAGVRGFDGAAVGLRAIRLLREAGLRVGVNTVLTRANVAQLEELGDALAGLGVAEWQWLRFKPAGRGAVAYERLALTAEQAGSLWPRLLALEERTGLVLRVDCALVPFLAAHGPSVEAMERLGVSGCPGGESLWSRAPEGTWAPCSFAHDRAATAADLRSAWSDDAGLAAWRARAEAPPEPCASCAYRAVCRGGCRVVAGHLTGDDLAPDPECPRVRATEAA